MVWNNLRIALSIATSELKSLFRNTKIILMSIVGIFINVQIIEPLRMLSSMMGSKVSFLEAFVVIGNAFIVELVIPLFFLVMISDFPKEGEFQYYYQIRTNKRTWALGQSLYAIFVSVAIVALTILFSMIFSVGFSHLSKDYSYATTKFLHVYPEENGKYISTLLPGSLFNQMKLWPCFVHTALLSILNYILMALIVLFFRIIGKKMIGFIIDVGILVLGFTLCRLTSSIKWVFPLSHTLIGVHFEEISSHPIFPIEYSYLYFGVLIVVLLIMSICFSKKMKVV